MKPVQKCRELPPGACFRLLSETEPCFIIDVRSPDEFSRGHLERAENIDFSRADFKDRLRTRDKYHRYLVYCRRGHRGRMAMEFLRDCGFIEVTNIAGGIERWESEGLPVDR